MTILETQLTKRQFEVARLLLQGLSNNEIAVQLHIVPRTVKAHLTQMYEIFEIREGIRRIKLAGKLHQNGCEAATYD